MMNLSSNLMNRLINDSHHNHQQQMDKEDNNNLMDGSYTITGQGDLEGIDSGGNGAKFLNETSYESNVNNMSTNIINFVEELSTKMPALISNTYDIETLHTDNNLTTTTRKWSKASTIAANTFSAVMLPSKQQQTNVSKSSSSSSSISISATPPPPSVLSSMLENDGQDYETLENDLQMSTVNIFIIGAIIITTLLFLMIFLIWLCCYKRDRSQYSIRKVPASRSHVNSMNESMESIDVVMSGNQKRRSNCSLYISNPNSEDSQPDLHSSSIIFQNQMASHPSKMVSLTPQHVVNHLNMDSKQQSLTIPNSLAGGNWVPNSNNNITNNNNETITNAQHWQMAQNLATYCQQMSLEQSMHQSTKKTINI